MEQKLASRDAPKRCSAADAFRAFVSSSDFPCVGAKSALALGHLELLEAGSIRDSAFDAAIHAALVGFGERLSGDQPAMQSFACLFRSEPGLDEQAFSTFLWRRLQALHDLDRENGIGWDASVSSDPSSSRFSMSVGGCAYFIVGLHPQSSRRARRFSRPAMVFNPHRQFQQLKADGRYAKMQETIRERDTVLQGGVNPMLAEFGERSEAIQYSGMRVDATWTCPLHVRG